ncbi:MAG TPA: hypothetical protein DDY29_16475 [Rhodobacteraceae bacterium]|jgi:hypothetical protein|nr:hypothetical protein [Paracoccaceae bacterium]
MSPRWVTEAARLNAVFGLGVAGRPGWRKCNAEPDGKRGMDAEASVMAWAPLPARLAAPGGADPPPIDHCTLRLRAGNRNRAHFRFGGQNRKGATLRTRFDSQIEYGRSGDWADPINLKLIALDLQPG